MSVTKRIAFGAAASWFSRGVTILLGLVLMPVLFRNLGKEELGLWLLLGQSWAAMGILDFGFAVTLTRRIALAKGASGSDPNAPLTPETLKNIADLVESGRRLYHGLAFVVFVISSLSGFFYLRHLHLTTINPATAWIAWTVLCASQALNVWATVWTCLLQGVGYVGWDTLVASAISITILGTQIFCVLAGGGVVTLACVAAAGALLQRSLTRLVARRRRPELFRLRGNWSFTLFKEMLPLALRAWLTALGTILVQNTDGFFIASSAGAKDIPAFRAAFLAVLNLHMLAGVFAASSSVFISHLWRAGRIAEVQRIVERNLRIGLCIMFCGGAAILTSGASLFNIWLGPFNYVGSSVVALFVITFVLEQHTFIISTGSRATENEAFAGCMIAGGVLKLFLAAAFMRRYGLIGLAAGTLLAQSATAYWFVPYIGLRRLQFHFGRYLFSVLGPCLVVFLFAAGAALLGIALLGPARDAAKLTISCITSGAVLAAGIWFLVLDARHRKDIASRILSRGNPFVPYFR